jgi:hypothetical protein
MQQLSASYVEDGSKVMERLIVRDYFTLVDLVTFFAGSLTSKFGPPSLQELFGTESTSKSSKSGLSVDEASVAGETKIRRIVESAMRRRTEQSVIK